MKTEKAEKVTKATFRGEIRTMWEGGPDRRWSQTKIPGAKMHLDNGGYGGSYVCQACREPTEGVYIAGRSSEHEGKWICGGCRNAEITKNATPRKAA